jgi:hypothetical protein
MIPKFLVLILAAIAAAPGLGSCATQQSLASNAGAESPQPAGLPALAAESFAPFPRAKAKPSAHEVWVALRTDERAGTGTSADPFDAGSVDKLNALFDRFRKEYGDNLTVHFGPGVYYGDRRWQPCNNWHILGAGIDVTVFKTAPNPERTATVGFYPLDVTGFLLADVTVDFNVLNLRRPNRVFTYPRAWGERRRVGYVFSKDLPAWMPGRTWQARQPATHRGMEFICLRDTVEEPGIGSNWSVLRPNLPRSLSRWKPGIPYMAGDAVSVADSGYVCLGSNITSNPTAGGPGWERIDPEAADPSISTSAVFGGTAWPGPGQEPAGHNRVSRIRAVNGNGSSFMDHEDFVIGLGGSDCVIENCVVEQCHGDYSSLIVIMGGRHSVVRGCSVKGNGEGAAYGGWGCFDAVFENNQCENMDLAVNIDSLNNLNLTFRNNSFVNCHSCGILINVGGPIHESFPDYWGELDGRRIDMNERGVDGLFIYDNYIERSDGARYGAIQVQEELLKNVQIHHNIVRTASGQARDCAIGVAKASNVSICGNRCDPNMYCNIAGVTGGLLCSDNFDFAGKPMVDFQGQPIDKKP